MTLSNLRRHLTVVLLACSTLLLLPRAACAQAAAEDATSAQVKYRQAHQAIDAKDWEQARRLLLELWAESQTYDVAVSLGQVEFWLKHHASGAGYLSFALRNIPPAEKLDAVERVKSGLAELKKTVGTVEVSVSEPDAEILLDGVLIGRSPLAYEIYVDVGPHRFEARLGTRPPAGTTLDALGGQNYKVDLTLQPEPAAAAPAPGTEAPPQGEPGRGKKNPGPLYVAGGVAAVGVALGIGFTVAASGTTDKIDALRADVGTGGCQGASSPTCTELHDSVEERDTERNISYASFAVAGAAVVAGVVYFLWPRPSRKASVGVSFLPGGTLVTVSGAL